MVVSVDDKVVNICPSCKRIQVNDIYVFYNCHYIGNSHLTISSQHFNRAPLRRVPSDTTVFTKTNEESCTANIVPQQTALKYNDINISLL